MPEPQCQRIDTYQNQEAALSETFLGMKMVRQLFDTVKQK